MKLVPDEENNVSQYVNGLPYQVSISESTYLDKDMRKKKSET